MPAKILVTNQRGGSRVALIGRSGKQLMTSELFREPRAKAATVRALKVLLGSEITVEDNTLSAKVTAVSKRGLNGKRPSTTKSPSTKKRPPTKRARALKKSSPTKRAASTRAPRATKRVTADARSQTTRTRRSPRKAG